MRNDPVKSALILATNFQSGKNVSIKADLSLIFVISDIQLLSTCSELQSVLHWVFPRSQQAATAHSVQSNLCVWWSPSMKEGSTSVGYQPGNIISVLSDFSNWLKPKYEFSDFRLDLECSIPNMRCYTSLTNTGWALWFTRWTTRSLISENWTKDIR